MTYRERQRLTWLLNRVGDTGIKLTGAGYLPPVHVEAAMTDGTSASKRRPVNILTGRSAP